MGAAAAARMMRARTPEATTEGSPIRSRATSVLRRGVPTNSPSATKTPVVWPSTSASERIAPITRTVASITAHRAKPKTRNATTALSSSAVGQPCARTVKISVSRIPASARKDRIGNGTLRSTGRAGECQKPPATALLPAIAKAHYVGEALAINDHDDVLHTAKVWRVPPLAAK